MIETEKEQVMGGLFQKDYVGEEDGDKGKKEGGIVLRVS